MRNLFDANYLKKLMLNENVDIKVIQALKGLFALIEDNDSFIEHNDTPASYSGMAGYVPIVNIAEDGLHFGTIDDIEPDMSAVEFEIIFDSTYRDYTEEFIWTGGVPPLAQKNYYTDSGKGTKIWQIDYSWTGFQLDQKVITHIGTGVSLTITYTWAAGLPTQKDRVIA
jgi:hypothetical protein